MDAGPDLTRALGALVVVLVLLFACAWVARRSGVARRFGGNIPVKVVGSLSVGPRERILILEVDNTWLVLGVTPGGMQTLHTLPAQPGAAPAVAADWRTSLARAMRRNPSDTPGDTQ